MEPYDCIWLELSLGAFGGTAQAMGYFTGHKRPLRHPKGCGVRNRDRYGFCQLLLRERSHGEVTAPIPSSCWLQILTLAHGHRDPAPSPAGAGGQTSTPPPFPVSDGRWKTETAR